MDTNTVDAAARQDLSAEAITADMQPAPDRDWWRGAVIYQIYPRSFQDSDGNGIGDLRGITRRLAYVASLGVDAIWVSPFYLSPMDDFGYDIADYCAVDPMFGTMEDFDAMIEEAHRLGLKVLIDQVFSHSSLRHPWFAESRSSRDNDKSDWYVWADPKPDGTVPNNWLSFFGGTAWAWDSRRRQYYLHNFLHTQPDLNMHNPQVQEAVMEVLRFWLDKGVDGFRFDVINFYFHSLGLEDNPALPEEERNDITAPSVNPYNYQRHLYDKSRPEMPDFLKRIRALLDEYPAAAAVGEVSDALRGLELASAYTSGSEKLQMCYSFEFLGPGPFDPSYVRTAIERFEEAAASGWSCWSISNHDVERPASRLGSICDPDPYNDPFAFSRMLATLMLALRGSVCIYQGEELGLPEAELTFEDLQDPYGREFWPRYKGRDGCRTPMVWTAEDGEDSFSAGMPWLPIAMTHRELAVERQEDDPESMLSHYRAAIAFRRANPILVKGTIRFLDSTEQYLVFERASAEETMLVAVNMSGSAVEIAVSDEADWKSLDSPGRAGRLVGDKAMLPPFGALFLSRNTPATSAPE